MRDAVAKDLIDTAYDFSRLIWPTVNSWCGGGIFQAVEDKNQSPTAQILDTLAGIDGFQRFPQKGIVRGVASRIQWTDKDWGTFTIRKGRSSGVDTELGKRLYALAHRDEGYLYPHLTIQGYITERRTGTLLSVALAHTKELIPWAYETWLKNGKPKYSRYHKEIVWEQKAIDKDGSIAWFLAVDWNAYQESGHFLKQWHCTDAMIAGMPKQQFLDWAEEIGA